ncbi:MAG: SMC-Scp complex subunit ScpB [Verrucomicrobiae bacterium]|nr:SMC-Scp complex subunit ScpB [Verrucomicrobiae bacterium]
MYCRTQYERHRAGELSQAALEVVSCIAFKQPISQAEIDLLFGDVDKLPAATSCASRDWLRNSWGKVDACSS